MSGCLPCGPSFSPVFLKAVFQHAHIHAQLHKQNKPLRTSSMRGYLERLRFSQMSAEETLRDLPHNVVAQAGKKGMELEKPRTGLKESKQR